MRKIHHISAKVKLQIIAEYKEKLANGQPRYSLKEIADKHEISLSSVYALVRLVGCKHRGRGGWRRLEPPQWQKKVLRDLQEPGITYEEVGRRNPYWASVGRKRRLVPRSRQRIEQIRKRWKDYDISKLKARGFVPGDTIVWDTRRFLVLRYDNTEYGAVQAEDGQVIDPFYWVSKGSRSVRVR